MNIAGWYNGYEPFFITTEKVVQRVLDANIEPLIVKYGHADVERAVTAAGSEWWTEKYVKPQRVERDGNQLADAVDAGARGVVINAEEGAGWHLTAGDVMERLIGIVRHRCPSTPIWVSLDTRADRLQQPYERAGVALADGVIPMVYPTLFWPSMPPGYVECAFADCLDGKDFQGKPVRPAIQAFTEGAAPHPGPLGVRAQLDEVLRRRLDGCSIYTVGAATAEEWNAIRAWYRDHGGVPQAPISEVAELKIQLWGLGQVVMSLDAKVDRLLDRFDRMIEAARHEP